MTNALLSPEGLAILTGADLIRANGTTEKVVAHHTLTLEVTKDGTVSFTEDPLENRYFPMMTEADALAYPMYMMLLDGNGEMSGVAVNLQNASAGSVAIAEATESPDAKPATCTITSELIKEKDVIMLDYYVQHDADAIQIDITPDQFAGYYYLEASTLFRRESDGADLPAEFIIPRGKIQSNFSFTLASTGDPSTFDFTMDAFPGYVVGSPAKEVLAAIQVLSADDNYDLASEAATDEIEYERYKYNQDQAPYLGVVSEGPVTKSVAPEDTGAAAGQDTAWA